MKLHFVITAGGTREYIDPVRFISNASSGKMGYALAEAVLEAGHRVALITGPTSLEPPKGILCLTNVENSESMFKSVQKSFKKCDVLVMAAAVSDYKVAKTAKFKIKKGRQPISITLVPTTDILKWAGEHKTTQYVVGFALEDKALLTRARGKLKSKNADMIIANSPAAIGASKSTAYIITANGQKKIGPENKNKLAKKIIAEILSQIS